MTKNTCYEWIFNSSLKDNLKGSLNFRKWKFESYGLEFCEIFIKDKTAFNKVKNDIFENIKTFLRKIIKKD